MTSRPHFQALAARAGVLQGYTDNSGAWCATADTVAEGLLDAMGFDSTTEAAALAALQTLDERERAAVIDPFTVVPFDSETRPALLVRDTRPFREGLLTTEAGAEIPLRGAPGVQLPVLEPGWHRIEIMGAGGRTHVQQRVVHPSRCFALADAIGAEDRFGIVANLYALRSSAGGSGIGDLAALRELVTRAGEAQAAFVGISPTHAVAYDHSETSPYCPDSRVFRNPIYIAPRDAPEFDTSVAARAAMDQLTDAAGPLDYDAVWAARLGVLRLLHAEFETRPAGPRRDAYVRFCHTHGEPLIRYAGFMTERIPDTTPELHRYLQFEIDRQLGLVARCARDHNMPLGLYTDIAVGTASGGADVHVYPDVFLPSVHLGAPPDAFAPDGQEWGVCPINPAPFGPEAGRYWRAVLESAMRHAGLVRIDHAMGLHRQFLVPRGQPPSRGAYVRFPSRELMGILALESHRHRAVVVGESLGTLPGGFLDMMHQAGILSTQVLYFERNADGSFRGSNNYPRDAVAQVNTHDLPTLRGYVSGHDIDVRAAFGLIGPDDVASKKTEREVDLGQLASRLREENINSENIGHGIHQFLGRTSARLAGVMFDDLADELDPVNLPEASGRSYRPWTRRNSKTIGAVFESPHALELLNVTGRAPQTRVDQPGSG